MSVGLSVTTTRPAQAAEATAMPFWMLKRMGQRTHVLDGGPDPPCKRAGLK